MKVQNGGAPNASPFRSICRTVGETSSFGGNPLELHIGLGPTARITSVDVYWPTTNSRQHFTGMPTNQFFQIKEFDTTFTRLDRKPIPVPASPSN